MKVQKISNALLKITAEITEKELKMASAEDANILYADANKETQVYRIGQTAKTLGSVDRFGCLFNTVDENNNLVCISEFDFSNEMALVRLAEIKEKIGIIEDNTKRVAAAMQEQIAKIEAELNNTENKEEPEEVKETNND